MSPKTQASQVPRKPHPDGRIPASRRDPSLGQKDRRRGYRGKGGRRKSQQSGAR